jgi:hypothetical protein
MPSTLQNCRLVSLALLALSEGFKVKEDAVGCFNDNV